MLFIIEKSLNTHSRWMFYNNKTEQTKYEFKVWNGKVSRSGKW